MLEKIIKRINRNVTYITPNCVFKVFCNASRYENELYFREKFEKYFKVPSILYKNKRHKLIKYKKLKAKPLKQYLNNSDKEEFFNLLYKLTNKLYLIEETLHKNKVLSYLKQKYESELKDFLKNSDYLNLIHGDFKVDNILYDGKDFYLIDFESSGYLFKEYDLAYLYFSILPYNKILADWLLDKIIIKKSNFELFLHCCRLFVYNVINYSNIKEKDKKLWYNVLEEINKDLKSLKSI